MTTHAIVESVDMSTRSMPKVAYDGQLMAEDLAANGLTPQDLVDKTNRAVALKTVYRFLANEVQSVRTARVLADALGFPVDRYLIRSRPPQTLAS